MGKKALMLGLGFLTLGTSLRADLPMAKNPPRVEIAANRMRFTKVAGGDWDDRTQKVQIEVMAKNLDFNRPANGLILNYWVFAESLVNRRDWLVIDSGRIDVNLTSTPEGRELRQKGKLVTLQWDDTNAVFGQRYKAWLLVLTNANQEIVGVKANVSSVQTGFQRAFALQTGSWCGTDLRPGSGPSSKR